MDSIPDGRISPEVRIVTEWHEALNGGDVDRLLDLSHPDVKVGGPRGVGHGSGLLRDWANRSGIHLAILRVFHAGETVVVEQAATWTAPDSGETTPSQTIATVFVVRGGLVASVVRFDNLADALSASGLDRSDVIENA